MPAIDAADLRAHLNLPSDDDDGMLESKIAAAQGWIEKIVGYKFGAPPECFEAEFADGVPAPLLEAVRQLAGHLYVNREATTDGPVPVETLPFGLLTLLTPYRSRFF